MWWNIFDDIEYSDMDFLRPYIIYTTTRTAPEELPSQISQFFETSEELIVEIEHDKSVCPIALGEGSDHGNCWQISLSTDVPISMKRQLEGHKTGRVMHGLLAPERIWSGRLFELKIAFNHKAGSAECLVFQEEDWIRRLLRGQVDSLPSIPPGSYLRAGEEKWVVDVSINRDGVEWNAVSTLTRRRFNNFSITYSLDFTNDLEKEHERILELISKRLEITFDEISNLSEIEELLIDELERWGFGEISPPCELLIEHTNSEYSLILKLNDEGINHVITKDTYQIDKNDAKEMISEVFHDLYNNGWISQFNVVNVDEVNEQFNEVLELIFELSDESENNSECEQELTLLEVIAKYREEVENNPERIRFLGDILLQLSIQNVDAKEFDEAIGHLDEAIKLLLECSMDNSSVKNNLKTGLLLLTEHQSRWPDDALRLLNDAQRKFQLMMDDKLLKREVQELYELTENLVKQVASSNLA